MDKSNRHLQRRLAGMPALYVHLSDVRLCNLYLRATQVCDVQNLAGGRARLRATLLQHMAYLFPVIGVRGTRVRTTPLLDVLTLFLVLGIRRTRLRSALLYDVKQPFHALRVRMEPLRRPYVPYVLD